MKKLSGLKTPWVVALGTVAIASASGFYAWSTYHPSGGLEESSSFTLSHPRLNQDVYPLYSGVSWSASRMETVTISTSTYSGASITSLPVKDTMDPGSVFTPFERYYDQKLTALGWETVNDLAAGGHVGGQTGYRKDGATILTRFQIVYHTVPENAPSECPCDVTLSLFSIGNK